MPRFHIGDNSLTYFDGLSMVWGYPRSKSHLKVKVKLCIRGCSDKNKIWNNIRLQKFIVNPNNKLYLRSINKQTCTWFRIILNCFSRITRFKVKVKLCIRECSDKKKKISLESRNLLPILITNHTLETIIHLHKYIHNLG